MLHEVLYALAGFPGDIVVEDRTACQESAPRLKLAAGIPHMEESERICIGRILEIGSAAMDLTYLSSRPCDSLYLRHAIDASTQILNALHVHVLKLEDRLLEGSLANCASLELNLHSWQRVLPAVDRLLREAVSTDVKGPGLLRFLREERCLSPSEPLVEKAIRKLEYGCLEALRLQLRNWLMHHSIVDPHAEFLLSLGEDGSAQVEAGRMLPWMTEQHARDVLAAGEILDKLRRRKQQPDPANLGAQIDAIVFAESSLALEVAVSALKHGAIQAIGSVVGVAAVKELLQTVRAVALLGDGLGWDTFLENLRGPLDITSASRAADAANLKNVKFKAFEETVAPCFSPEWPLSEILGPEEEERYASIFAVLLPVRAALLKLNDVWLVLHRGGLKRGTRPASQRLDVTLQRLRTQMSNFLENLTFYFQVDVIESTYRELLDKMDDANSDFTACVQAHRKALHSMSVECFTSSRVVSAAVHEVVQRAEELVSIVLASHEVVHDKEPRRVESIQERADDLRNTFERNSLLLFQLLSSVKSVRGSPGLARLVLRLDLSEYYSNMFLSSARR
mmetsp:Transcript_564/g.1916  ORF Transcript_564/g.1916 Transcript_564/m.1916 type:complete len:566 (+) Transcript_564:33-1730(+)